MVAEAVEDARANAVNNGLDKRTSFFVGDLASVLKDYSHLPPPDIVITDPPRGGMPPGCVDDMIRLGASAIIYVSCNIVTQQRDIELLAQKGGYELKMVQAVDMFPNTPHMESVALLEKGPA
eukprot:Tamp_36316.p1 GENE.Tamp_36316~~Tamp_36316.p1  ORF type:complete len:122 (-),score=28.51 Tamp_36316:7-372(-)